MDFKLARCSATAVETEDGEDEDGGGASTEEDAAGSWRPAIAAGSWRPAIAAGSWSPATAAVLRRGWAIGKRLAVVGAAVTSAPVVVPPLLIFSTLGLALSVPFGIYFAGFACTEKLMSSLLPLPKEEELLREWERNPAAEVTIAREERSLPKACKYAISVLPLDRDMMIDEEKATVNMSDLADGEREKHGGEVVAIDSPATVEARDNGVAEEVVPNGMPIGERRVAEEAGEESNAVADGHELQPLVVSLYMSEDLEGSDDELKMQEDGSVLDSLKAVEANEEVRCSGDGGQERETSEIDIVVNLVADEIENNFENSTSEVDALVPDAEGVAEAGEGYGLIEQLRVADGWQEEEEVGVGVVEEDNAPVPHTSEIAYNGEQGVLIAEELCAGDRARVEELRDVGIVASVLDVPMFDAIAAQEKETDIAFMVENPVTGVPDENMPTLDAQVASETGENILLMGGQLQLEDEWSKEEVNELALGDNAAAVELEVSSLPIEVVNDLKNKWLRVTEELMAAEAAMGNGGGIDEGVNEPGRKKEEVEADAIEVSYRSSDIETNAFVEQLQGAHFDVTEPTSLGVPSHVEAEVKTSASHLSSEDGTMNDQTTFPSVINSDYLNSKDEADERLKNAMDHDEDGGNEEAVGDVPQTNISRVEAETDPSNAATAPRNETAQEISAVSAMEDGYYPSGVADRELDWNTEPSARVRNYATPMPSDDESWNGEEKLWQQVYALRTIVGYKAPLRSSLVEELKDLYMFTGIDMSSDPSVGRSDLTVLQLKAQLQFLKSVIGVE